MLKKKKLEENSRWIGTTKYIKYKPEIIQVEVFVVQEQSAPNGLYLI